MVFLPKADVLTLEELAEVSLAFIDRGVKKIRVTGGEPLVRPGVIGLFERLGRKLGSGLEELTLTTNGTLLKKFAKPLLDTGVRRINVSLDSLDEQTFLGITRRGNIDDVLEGIDAALHQGLEVKINTVALKNTNEHELTNMVGWAHAKGMDITFIEVMPMADTGVARRLQFLPLTKVRDALERRWELSADEGPKPMSGPARYLIAKETGRRIGFISPLTNNFCAGCNRVRVTCTGRLYMCLGQDDQVDLRKILRSGQSLNAAFDRALLYKPEQHSFEIDDTSVASGTMRHMSTTGG